MATTLPATEDSSVTYEQLNDLSAEFDDAETELIRQEVVVKRPLYEKRHKLISQIPNFWTLVFEQAPPDIDEFIQPSDSSLLLTSLTSLSVTRFEIENGGQGDPRSLCFRFEFGGNDHFEDKVIEKKFWHRRSKGGWSGLVSEPVEIHWKKGKDLTGGLLGTVKKVWAAQQAEIKTGDANPKDLTADERALKKKIENTGLGGLSFFAWFGYVGRNVSAVESQEATEKARKERIARQEAQAQEQDDVSDDDFESDADEKDEDEKDAEGAEEEVVEEDELPPAKRRKA
ncbi:Protein SET [Cytospora mali]|uniref:Protein SET n=1 Tax=Cytospora mali TaxID=578113 RepID=A0A194W688_CYTMA|nr:Protein SET [Valsa mali]